MVRSGIPFPDFQMQNALVYACTDLSRCLGNAGHCADFARVNPPIHGVVSGQGSQKRLPGA